MSLFRYYPLPSDRMGTLWTLCSIKDACIIEYGPSGNTSFAIEGLRSLNAKLRANVFTTHIDENDMVLGINDNLIYAIKEVDEKYNPNIIFILASSLAAVTGIDIIGICNEMQKHVQARLIPADQGGYLGDYTYGIRNTLKLLCLNVVENRARKYGRVEKYNIIGSQIDYYNYRADTKEIKRQLSGYFGFECNAVLTSESSMREICKAGEADFNIVMRSEGLDAAEVLWERFEQPFVFGRPYGVKATVDFLRAVSKITGKRIDEHKLQNEIMVCKKNIFTLKKQFNKHKLRFLLSGNYDLVLGFEEFLKELGVENTFKIINHKLSGKKYFGYDDNADGIKVNPSEEEVINYLSELKPNMVFGDATLLEMAEQRDNVYRYQISNPNRRQFRFYDGTPFIGFNGVMYLCEVFFNVMDCQ